MCVWFKLASEHVQGSGSFNTLAPVTVRRCPNPLDSKAQQRAGWPQPQVPPVEARRSSSNSACPDSTPVRI
jgi:hypothetical protein